MAETLADKVNWLFQHVPDPETGRLMSTPLVAAKMRHLGFDISDNTIRNLRTGEVERPSWPVIEGLAKVFRVAPGFFSADSSIHDLEQQLEALALLRDTKLWNLAERALGVSPEGVEMAVDVAMVVLERYRELEGLENRDAIRRLPDGDKVNTRQPRSARHSRRIHPVRETPVQGTGPG